VLRSSSLVRHLDGQLAAWGPGWAEVQLPTAPPQGNLVGTVHGAIVTAAADAAFEVACNSWGRVAVATSITVFFTAPAALGTVLTATATEVSRGRRTASYRIDVVDDAGALVAWVQALAHRTSRWHLGAARWPHDWRERY